VRRFSGDREEMQILLYDRVAFSFRPIQEFVRNWNICDGFDPIRKCTTAALVRFTIIGSADSTQHSSASALLSEMLLTLPMLSETCVCFKNFL
jgi:hypothetical protein